MRHPIIPTPMPVVLSVNTAAEAAEQFGAGSQLHRLVGRLHPPPPPTPEERAESERRRAEYAVLAERAREAWAIPAAFAAVGDCIALVEAHARVLAEVDGSAEYNMSGWREHAFASLALLFERSPELLPIGPAVHADCGGDDR